MGSILVFILLWLPQLLHNQIIYVYGSKLSQGCDYDDQNCDDFSNSCLKNDECESGYCNKRISECVPQHCFDNKLNLNETDIDCGGNCLPCENDKRCSKSSDCLSSYCQEICLPQECTMACGAHCNPCELGEYCVLGFDCKSGNCTQGICFPSVGVSNQTITSKKPFSCYRDFDCDSGWICLNSTCYQGHCRDNIQNIDETSMDCGGSCPSCGIGDGCLMNTDCNSGLCVSQKCVPENCTMDGPSANCSKTSGSSVFCESNMNCVSRVCSLDTNTCLSLHCVDNLLNFDETDVDCGGKDCFSCPNGKNCRLSRDCSSNYCDIEVGLCIQPECANGVKDLIESDIDCGGDCSPCKHGFACNSNLDCQEGFCHNETRVCMPYSCQDEIMNFNETGIDCGGQCSPCGVGGECNSRSGCGEEGLVCVGGYCLSTSCKNELLDSNESDTDCGGDCLPCEIMKQCRQSIDCLSGACFEGFCVSKDCTDGIMNKDETDVDCGGISCLGCRRNSACIKNADCLKGLKCFENSCDLAHCHNNRLDRNETDIDCGGNCLPCENGMRCELDLDCSELHCSDKGFCMSDHCFNGVQDVEETDIDCGGNCGRCGLHSTCHLDVDCDLSQNLTCASHVCLPKSCFNSIQDSSETDVDCGGECSSCSVGMSCNSHGDCESHFCAVNHICLPKRCESSLDCLPGCGNCLLGEICDSTADCVDDLVCKFMSGKRMCSYSDEQRMKEFLQPSSCNDSVLNNDETDIDCGGEMCSPCDKYGKCLLNRDCKFDLVCGRSGKCVPISCENSILDGFETDIDCGGSDCTPCNTGKKCTANDDCLSGVCTRNICVGGSCSDGKLNGQETDVDCGGPLCESCELFHQCEVNSDCKSGGCDPSLKLCVPIHCFNGIKDEDESGIDCGGTSCRHCGTNNEKESCHTYLDCSPDSYCHENVCLSKTCLNGVFDEGETDVDCGGHCKKCPNSYGCESNSDCLSKFCSTNSKTCLPITCRDGIIGQNESDVDCGGLYCDKCTNKKKCILNSDCISDFCHELSTGISICIPAHCSNKIQDLDESDVDCGGSCSQCSHGQYCITSEDCMGECDLISSTCKEYSSHLSELFDCEGNILEEAFCSIPSSGYHSCADHLLDSLCDDFGYPNLSCNKFDYDSRVCNFGSEEEAMRDIWCSRLEEEEDKLICMKDFLVIKEYENVLRPLAVSRLRDGGNAFVFDRVVSRSNLFFQEMTKRLPVSSDVLVGFPDTSNDSWHTIRSLSDMANLFFRSKSALRVYQKNNVLVVNNTGHDAHIIKIANLVLDLGEGLQISMCGAFVFMGNLRVVGRSTIEFRSKKTRINGNLWIDLNSKVRLRNTLLSINGNNFLLNSGLIEFLGNAHTDKQSLISLDIQHFNNFGRIQATNAKIHLINTVIVVYSWSEVVLQDSIILSSVGDQHSAIVSFGTLEAMDTVIGCKIVNYGLIESSKGELILDHNLNNGGIIEVGLSAVLKLNKNVLVSSTERYNWQDSSFRTDLRVMFAAQSMLYGVPKELIVSVPSNDVAFVNKGSLFLSKGSKLEVGKDKVLLFSNSIYCDADSFLQVTESSQLVYQPYLHFDEKKAASCIYFVSVADRDSYFSRRLGSMGVFFKQRHSNGSLSFTRSHTFGNSTIIVGNITIDENVTLEFQGPVLIIGEIYNEGIVRVRHEKSVFMAEYVGKGDLQVDQEASLNFIGMANIAGELKNEGKLEVGYSKKATENFMRQHKTKLISVARCSISYPIKFQVKVSTVLVYLIELEIDVCNTESVNDLVLSGLLPSIFAETELWLNDLILLSPSTKFGIINLREEENTVATDEISLDDVSYGSIEELLNFPGSSLTTKEEGILVVSGLILSTGSLYIKEKSFFSASGGSSIVPNQINKIHSYGTVWFEKSSNTFSTGQYHGSGNSTNDGNLTISGNFVSTGKMSNSGILYVKKFSNATMNTLFSSGEIIAEEHSLFSIQKFAEFTSTSVFDSSGLFYCYIGSSITSKGIFVSSGELFGDSCTWQVVSEAFYLDGIFQLDEPRLKFLPGARVFINGDSAIEDPEFLDISAQVQVHVNGHMFIETKTTSKQAENYIHVSGELIVGKEGHLSIDSTKFILDGIVRIDGQAIWSASVAQTSFILSETSEFLVSADAQVEFGEGVNITTNDAGRT